MGEAEQQAGFDAIGLSDSGRPTGTGWPVTSSPPFRSATVADKSRNHKLGHIKHSGMASSTCPPGKGSALGILRKIGFMSSRGDTPMTPIRPSRNSSQPSIAKEVRACAHKVHTLSRKDTKFARGTSLAYLSDQTRPSARLTLKPAETAFRATIACGRPVDRQRLRNELCAKSRPPFPPRPRFFSLEFS